LGRETARPIIGLAPQASCWHGRVTSNVRPRRPHRIAWMATTTYDPDVSPVSAEWLSLDEQERIRLALNYHVAKRAKAGSLKAHAALHVVVENQVATGFGPTVRAIERLQKEGLSRHDAVHAIASVLTEHLHAAANGTEPQNTQSFQAAINASIEQLSAQAWLRRYRR
jgi:hypothetical protein